MDFLKRKINKALFYPATIIFVATVVTVAMLVWVVPQFTALFASFNAALPAATLVVIKLSAFVQTYGWVVVILFFVILGLMWWLMKRSSRVIYFVDRYLLKIPIIGSILLKAIIARFTRTLAITFAAGLPLADALTTVSGVTGNQIYTQAILRIRENLLTGQSLQQAIRATKLFPSIVEQMIAVGEESGTLDIMLDKIAKMFEEDVEHKVDNLSQLLEPFIMIVLGIVIGGLIIAMYLPIFRLGSVV